MDKEKFQDLLLSQDVEIHSLHYLCTHKHQCILSAIYNKLLKAVGFNTQGKHKLGVKDEKED